MRAKVDIESAPSATDGKHERLDVACAGRRQPSKHHTEDRDQQDAGQEGRHALARQDHGGERPVEPATAPYRHGDARPECRRRLRRRARPRQAPPCRERARRRCRTPECAERPRRQNRKTPRSFRYWTYCTMIGRSKPRLLRKASTASCEAPSGTSSRVGSPEKRMTMKTIVSTPRIAMTAWTSRPAA